MRLPLEERRAGAIHIEIWIIGFANQLFHVIPLIGDCVFCIIAELFARLPLGHICQQTGFVLGYSKPPHNHIPYPPGLSVKHIKREPLILHAKIK